MKTFANIRGLAAHLACLLDEFLDHPPLGFDGDAVRHLDQQLDQPIHDLALTRDAVKGEQCQTDALRVAAQLPGILDRRPPPEPLDLVGVKATQQARRQRKPAQQLKLADLGEQALQPNPPWVGCKARKRSTLSVIGKQSIEPSAGTGVELVSHPLQYCVVMRGLGRMQDAVEPVCAWPGDPFARKPEGDLLLQGGRCRLSWQQVIGKPASESGLSRLVEGRDRKVVEDCAAMPPPGAPCPVVAVKRVCSNTNLAGQVSDNELRVCAARSRRRSSVGRTRGVGRRLALLGFHQGRSEPGLIFAAQPGHPAGYDRSIAVGSGAFKTIGSVIWGKVGAAGWVGDRGLGGMPKHAAARPDDGGGGIRC